MAYLITPIEVDGVIQCVDPTTKITPVVLNLQSTVSAGIYTIYRSIADPTDPASNPNAVGNQGYGEIIFGVG